MDTETPLAPRKHHDDRVPSKPAFPFVPFRMRRPFKKGYLLSRWPFHIAGNTLNPFVAKSSSLGQNVPSLARVAAKPSDFLP